MDGGTGNDTILGGDGADMLIGGDGNDFIDGNRGNDVAFLGAGNDTFQWDPGDGSDTVEGQGGSDTMLFNGANVSENIDISANGQRVRFTRDVGQHRHGPQRRREESISTRLGGADTITVNDLSGTDVSTVNLDLAGTRRRRRRPGRHRHRQRHERRRLDRGQRLASSVNVTGSGGDGEHHGQRAGSIDTLADQLPRAVTTSSMPADCRPA